jgi:hypothetical protein
VGDVGDAAAVGEGHVPDMEDVGEAVFTYVGVVGDLSQVWEAEVVGEKYWSSMGRDILRQRLLSTKAPKGWSRSRRGAEME